MNRTRKLVAHSLDAIQRRESRHRQQEMSHLESQHPSRPAPTRGTNTLGVNRPPTSAQVDEIPQSPPPRHPEPRRSQLFVARDSQSSVPEDESLNLGGLEAEAEATTSPAMRRTHGNHGLFFDSPGRDETPVSVPRSTADIRNIIMGRQPQPRTWIDRQPNAHRISPISESQSVERPRPSAAPPISRKRPRPESDSEDSDDGFDQDDRDIDTAARRAQKSPQAPVVKRPRIQQSTESDAAHQLQESLTASSQSQQPARPLPIASTQVSTQLAEEQPRSRWLAANSVAGEQPTFELNYRSSGKNTWSDAETERLIMLMARHGTAWAEIKRQDDLCPTQDGGPMLTKRSQVNLKDKARNLKEKFLREGVPLPKNFDRIAVGRRR